MAKVFTITQGLENMGALKTGGQGSVYKGRRIGEIITAVKLLPTPIYSEDNDDKNFRDFKNEVQKLKRVNEKPNPNVVKILSSGLSETGNFPFIEMEYIEGPDLEELLKPPHNSVFSIKEVIKVAEQLSNALAHCHSLGVKHGDLKSNNVKFNIHTGNYVLLDFGLAIMSDEQRRTSLRQAGAVEFMAPEQNEGQMLFQTDVYSFGIVLFELLTGKVPFPLQDKGETARNYVRLAHMETLPPDVVSLRKDALPDTWPAGKRAREMNIPDWLITLIYKCIKKKPENRFINGIELHEYIINNSIHSIDPTPAGQTDAFKGDFEKLLNEKAQLQQQVLHYRQQLDSKEKEINDLKIAVTNKDDKNKYVNTTIEDTSLKPAKKGSSTIAFTAFILLAIGLAAFLAYNLFNNNRTEAERLQNADTNFADTAIADEPPVKKVTAKKENTAKNKVIPPVINDSESDSPENAEPEITLGERKKNIIQKDSEQVKPPAEVPGNAQRQYMVISKAYFYNAPDENDRRNAFVVPANNAIVNALDEQNDFVYVIFTNQLGQTSKGWLQKKNLQPLNE